MKWKAIINVDRILIAIAVMVIAVLIFRGCSANKSYQQKIVEKEEQRKKEVDSMQKRFKHHVAYAWAEITKWQDSSESLLAEIEVLRYERNESWKGLEKNKEEADKLISNIRNKQGKDSADCLELATKYSDAAGQVVMYKNKSDQLISRLDTAGAYKDKIISTQEELAKRAIALNDTLSKQYDSLYSSFKKVSPSASISGGFTVMGSRINPLTGAGIAGLFTQKNGNSIGVNALMLRDAELYFQGTYYWKFSLKRKK